MRPAVLGFRPHTGWSALVALAGDPAAPEVVERRRLTLIADNAGRFVYHVALEQPSADPERTLAEARAAALDAARREIGAAIASLAEHGFAASAAAMPNPKAAPGPLDYVIASHARIHAAEGWFWRSAVAIACDEAGLPITVFEERALPRHAAAALGEDEALIPARVLALGQGLGPPWAEDQRICALAAWMVLASAQSRTTKLTKGSQPS